MSTSHGCPAAVFLLAPAQGLEPKRDFQIEDSCLRAVGPHLLEFLGRRVLHQVGELILEGGSSELNACPRKRRICSGEIRPAVFSYWIVPSAIPSALPPSAARSLP